MPDTSRIILHIGASKCGSTSLQTALIRQPAFTARDGRAYEYVAIDRKGGLLRGAALTRQAEASPTGSAASPDVPSPERLREALMPAIPALAGMIKAGVTPILSSEGWGRKADIFAQTGFVEQLGGGARAILFVRPPIDWINSAWWQWGVWTGLELDAYVSRQAPNLRWHKLADAWREVSGVASVDIGLATSDVTRRFYDMLDAYAPPKVESNAGLPPAFLLFLLRNRKYRPDAHNSKTDFVVARHLPPGRHPTPWVLGPAQMARIDAALDGAADALRQRLGPEDRAAFDADPRWTGAGAYAGRAPDDLSRHETPEALADLIALLRGGLGFDADRARATATEKLAQAKAPLKTADAMIAKSVDSMLDRQQAGAKTRPGFLRRLTR